MPVAHEILGVSLNATEEEIHKAYRNLARQFHPDVNKEPGSESKFQDINAAYNALINKKPEPQRQQFNPFSGFHQTIIVRQAVQVPITLAECISGFTRTINGESINFPSGLRHGMQINHNESLIFIIQWRPNNMFKPLKDGSIEVSISATWLDMILGNQVPVLYVDGSNGTIDIPPYSQNGYMVRVPGQGLPKGVNSSERFDLLVKLNVRMPNELPENVLESLKSILQL